MKASYRLIRKNQIPKIWKYQTSFCDLQKKKFKIVVRSKSENSGYALDEIYQKHKLPLIVIEKEKNGHAMINTYPMTYDNLCAALNIFESHGFAIDGDVQFTVMTGQHIVIKAF